METFTPLSAVIGGGLIGLAASVLLLFHGRVAGISGVLGEALQGNVRGEGVFRIAFLVGLAIAGLTLRVLAPSVFGQSSAFSIGEMPFVIGAGLLVGYGTRLGSGCTSGHGVCGISRLSMRSVVATLTFMGAAGVVVFVIRHVLGGSR